MKYYVLFGLLTLFILFSGCINLDYNGFKKDFNAIKTIDKNLDSNKNEFIEKINIIETIDSNMIIKTRKELDLNELKDINKQSINKNIDILNLDSHELKDCNLNIKNQNIDINKYIYQTFKFTYKNYDFEYKIKLFNDLIQYSTNLKEQYCYKFNEDESPLRYTQDKYNNELIEKIAKDFNNLLIDGFNNNEIVEIAIRFIQEMPYNYNQDIQNRYPYETFYLGKGVCLDKTVILAKLLEYLGYETYIVIGISDPKTNLAHSTVGIICQNGKYILNNKNFCQIETTNTFFVDELNYNGVIKPLKISDGKSYVEDSYGPRTNEILKNNESDMNNILIQLNKLANDKNWQEYNNLIIQYNSELYNIMKLRFENYQ